MEAKPFARHFIEGLELRLATPRDAKLYVNAVTFALALLEQEARPVDLLLMEGIRVFYPKLARGQYFQRYFTDSVPPGDIGDLEAKSFLNGIASFRCAATLCDWGRQHTTELDELDRLADCPVNRSQATAYAQALDSAESCSTQSAQNVHSSEKFRSVFVKSPVVIATILALVFASGTAYTQQGPRGELAAGGASSPMMKGANNTSGWSRNRR